MPSYDFRCESCGNSFTASCSIKEKDQVRCPECGGATLKQLFTGFTFLTGGSKSSSSCGGGGRFT
ncbi:hypothetical protein SY88_19705 [Clostridiales bacterium PH28_bin88]|nr:hypothetical protein SY88_19705 [Clostridiales bacterium PH28_bin88]